MKRLLWLFILAVSPVVAASAQSVSGAPQSPPGLKLDEPSWSSVSPTFFGSGGDSVPVTHPTVRTDRTGSRISYRGARRVSDFGRTTISGGGSGGIWRNASVWITNTGAVAIKSVRLEYVFTDPATGTEVLRIKQRNTKRLKPGESHVYSETLHGSKRNRRGDGARMSVEIMEVVYADKTVWRRH